MGTDLVQCRSGKGSRGRLLPPCTWSMPEVAAGLSTSRKRKDGCEVGEPAKANWNLYLSLTTSNLSDTAVVQKELVPFTMKLCTHLTYNSQRPKEDLIEAGGMWVQPEISLPVMEQQVPCTPPPASESFTSTF